MTISELIAILATMPADAPVLICYGKNRNDCYQAVLDVSGDVHIECFDE